MKNKSVFQAGRKKKTVFYTFLATFSLFLKLLIKIPQSFKRAYKKY